MPMPLRASGTFEVTLTPQPTGDGAPDDGVGRMALVKTFRGDLDATSRGLMLAARTGEPGSAGYVALERVRGTLHGRAGTFVLQHSGTLTRGVASLSVTVVPDSGTEELTGLSGSMTIDASGGTHSYGFEYTLGTPSV